jgi:hypothetical protein
VKLLHWWQLEALWKAIFIPKMEHQQRRHISLLCIIYTNPGHFSQLFSKFGAVGEIFRMLLKYPDNFKKFLCGSNAYSMHRIFHQLKELVKN